MRSRDLYSSHESMVGDRTEPFVDWARLAGGVLLCLVAVPVPTLDTAQTLALGAITTAYAAGVLVARTRLVPDLRTLTARRWTFALDLLLAIAAMLLLSADPHWTPVW